MYENGLYCCTRPAGAGVYSLYQKMTELGIPNLIPINDLHCTVQYSKRPPLTSPWNLPSWSCHANVTGFEMWKTNSGKNCLVATLDCDHLKKFHIIQRRLMGLSYSFPEYKPHMTVSYDVPDGTPIPQWTGPVDFYGLEYSDLDAD